MGQGVSDAMAGKVTGKAAEVGNSRPWMFLAVLCAAYLAAQVLPATRLVYNPQEVSIDGQTVTLARSFPGDALGLPRPRIAYRETVRPLTPGHNGGQSCMDEGGPFRRYDTAEPVGTWDIAWAEPCLSDPRGYAWQATWTWHLGVFTFGPVNLTQRVFTDQEQQP